MKKALKIAALLGVVVLAILASGMTMAAKKAVPEYVGSQACLGCHADRWSSWAGSKHAGMVTQVKTTADIPGWDKATEEQKAEIIKADYVVSGGRFVARNKETGKLEFLKYEWNHDEGYWFDYDAPGTKWQDNCMGCHVTGNIKAGTANVTNEFGIGCESCHGPGRDHIQNKGDISKITMSASADVCGQCHNSGYKMADNRWIMGYKPNMKLTDVKGIIMPALDPNKTATLGHHKTYNEWLVSGHGPKAVADLKSNDHASAACYACHTQEGLSAKQGGKEFKLDKEADYVAISCVSCHRPHGLGKAGDEKTLCTQCHNGSLAAGTSVKPGATPHHPMKEFFEGWGAAGGITSNGNFHKEVTCQECHMANNNHLMQVVNPNAKDLDAHSNDACTKCHKDSTRESRGAYMEMWIETTTAKLTQLHADLDVIDAAVKDGTTLSTDAKLKYDTAKTNILFVEADGSKGAHNFDYAQKILSAAGKDLAAVKASIGR